MGQDAEQAQDCHQVLILVHQRLHTTFTIITQPLLTQHTHAHPDDDTLLTHLQHSFTVPSVC